MPKTCCPARERMIMNPGLLFNTVTLTFSAQLSVVYQRAQFSNRISF